MSDEISIERVLDYAFKKAQSATGEYLSENGDNWYPCGFAWVTVRPGNSKLARVLQKQYGAGKAYGGGVQVWNPSGYMTQQMDAKYAGAKAFAETVNQLLGPDMPKVRVYAECRMD